MRTLTLDPLADQTLDALWNRNENVARAIETALDWIEADPPDARARRRRFSNGMWVIPVGASGEEWTVIWEEQAPDQPVVRLITETTSI